MCISVGASNFRLTRPIREYGNVEAQGCRLDMARAGHTKT
jgi:hypothetical protein